MADEQLDLTLNAPGERLDRALALAHPALSRVQWQRLIKTGRVLVNGRKAKASQPTSGGERIVAQIPVVEVTPLVAEDIPLDICYEDDDLVVVNKPAGMVVHPAPGHSSGTLVNALLAHCDDLAGIGGELRPGIVHRLDKDTSGLIVVAKNDQALRHAQAQFKARTVAKRYVALVEGRLTPPAATIDAPIGRDPAQRKRMTVIPPNSSARAREAVTVYLTLESFDRYTLVECHPQTGRTHQLRVHLAYVGYPIVGDRIYGRRRPSVELSRHFLHAVELVLKRPSDDSVLTLRADLPSDLQQVLESIRAQPSVA